MAAIRTYYLYSFIWLKPDDDPVIATTNFIHRRTTCDRLNYILMGILCEWKWFWLLATTTTIIIINITAGKMKKWKEVIKFRLRFKPHHEPHGLETRMLISFSVRQLLLFFLCKRQHNATYLHFGRVWIVVVCREDETIRLDRYRPNRDEKERKLITSCSTQGGAIILPKVHVQGLHFAVLNKNLKNSEIQSIEILSSGVCVCFVCGFYLLLIFSPGA